MKRTKHAQTPTGRAPAAAVPVKYPEPFPAGPRANKAGATHAAGKGVGSTLGESKIGGGVKSVESAKTALPAKPHAEMKGGLSLVHVFASCSYMVWCVTVQHQVSIVIHVEC